MNVSRSLLRIKGFYVIAMVLVVGLSVGLTASAGPVTGGPNNPPYVETGVYQGVVSIIPGGAGDSIMEIGNLGSDFASTGDIYLRPQSSAGPNAGVRFAKNSTSGKADLHVYGRLCLAGSCLDTWPVVGGTSFWTQTSTWLEPITAGRGLYTSLAGGAWEPNLQIFGDHPDAALYISKQGIGGTALTVDGQAYIYGDLNINSGQITVLDCPPGLSCAWPDGYSVATVWHPGNDGQGSGLDAALLDGVRLGIFREPYAGSLCGGLNGQWCICGQFDYVHWTCLDI